ncbi:hypothetical protein D3C87_1390210 [compost metagenome]
MRAALDFALQVFADVGAHLLDAAVGDTERLREGVVHFRQVRPLHLLQRDRELGGLAGHFLAVVVSREGQRERLALAQLQAQRGLLEFGQHAAFAQHECEVIGLAAGEFHAVDLADEVQRHAVAVLGSLVCATVAMGAGLATHVVVHALLAQDVDGLVDLGVADFRLGAGHFSRGQVAQLDFRVHLEGGFERHFVVRHAVGLQVELGLAGHFHVLGLRDVEELAGSLVEAHFELDLLAILLLDHLHRHLARAEAGHLHRLRQAHQAFLGFLLHFGLGNSQGYLTVQLAEVFNDVRHGR